MAKLAVMLRTFIALRPLLPKMVAVAATFTTFASPHITLAAPTSLRGASAVESVMDVAARLIEAPTIVEAQYKPQDTLLFDAGGSQLGSIPGPSGSVATDAAGTLYVSSYRSDFVRVYDRPFMKAREEFHFKGKRIKVVAVNSASGMFAVFQDSTNLNGDGPGAISFFRKGAAAPCNVVARPSNILAFNNFAAFDRAGVLYFTADDSSGNFVIDSIVGGCQATTMNQLTFSTGVTPHSIAFDTNDDLVVQDFFNGQKIYTFAHPKNNQLGQPIAETVLNMKENGLVPVFLVLATDGKHLWAGSSATTQDRYVYPGGGNPVGPTLKVQQGGGMAVIPAETP